MFNKKLKQKIASLEEEILIVKKDIERRVWKLENPPKYKIGDKYKKGYIVNDVILRRRKLLNNNWLPTFLQIHNPNEPCLYFWEYSIVDIKTGKTSTI